MAGSPRPAQSNVASSSFFRIYKKGQGYYTRVGTAVGGGLLVLAGGHFVWSSLTFDENSVLGMWMQVVIPLVVILTLGVLLFWIVGVHRRSCDFMIATEGEMKKVNWTTKRQLKASTIVVIVATLIMASLLFIVDLGFMNFFSWIGVLYRGGS